MNELFIEYGHVSVNKQGESICGDSFEILKNGSKRIFVLSDGLGSGVKANILSTLTAKILSSLLARNLPMEECIQTVASTLPVCQTRKLAYATFTAICIEGSAAYLSQYDNPPVILMRGGKCIDYPRQVQFIGEKEIHVSQLALEEGDFLVMMSDGVTHAGIGKVMPAGFSQKGVTDLLAQWYTPEIAPQRMAATIADACLAVSLGAPDDDLTALVLKVERRKVANLIIGPPQHREDDEKILRMFFAKEGFHIVCGGSTASVVGNFLGKPVIPLIDTGDDDMPIMASIEGVDLVTEGVITLQHVVELAKEYQRDSSVSLQLCRLKDGASALAGLLFERATDVNIFFGQSANRAHEVLDIDFTTKESIVRKLKELLIQMGKNVKISLC
ncbi:MAG: SpoIIE family protein phosphatase [Clostridia bacterium]